MVGPGSGPISGRIVLVEGRLLFSRRAQSGAGRQSRVVHARKNPLSISHQQLVLVGEGFSFSGFQHQVPGKLVALIGVEDPLFQQFDNGLTVGLEQISRESFFDYQIHRLRSHMTDD